MEKNDRSGVASGDWDLALPTNYLLHTMVKQLNISINDKEVNRDPQTYSYRAILEAQLGCPREVKESVLTCALWYESDMERGKFLTGSELDKSKSKNIDLIGNIHSDLGFLRKALPGGCTLRLKFIMHDPKFFLKLPANFSAKLVINEATLYVAKLKVSPELLHAHQKALMISPAKYFITRCEVRQRTIMKGAVNADLEHVVTGQAPRRAQIFLVKNKAYNGAYNEDPFFFHHFDLSHIECFIDGRSYPSSAYTPNFTEGKYIREYHGFLDSLGQNFTESTITFDRLRYELGNVIFGFNFADDNSNGCGMNGHLNPIKRGSLGIKIMFRKPLPEAINVLVYCEFDNVIEIDKDHQVTTDYN